MASHISMRDPALDEAATSTTTPLSDLKHSIPAGLLFVLVKCNQAAVRAVNDREALRHACDLLVRSRCFRGASIGFNQAGKHKGSRSHHCFIVNADSQLIGTLTLSSADPEGFSSEVIALMSDWCEGFAAILSAVRRRAVYGRHNTWLGNHSELEDLRRTEAALRRSEAFLAKAQQLSLTGSFSWTTSTGLVVCSTEARRILGYENSARSLSLSDLLNQIDSEDKERAREIFERAAREGEVFDIDLRLLSRDGSRKHLRILAQPISCPLTDEFVGAMMDVSAAKELEEAIAFRDLVMGIVGHDLRSPLSAILALAGLARFADDLTPSTIEKLIVIERSARRMHEMVEALLDLTRTRFAGRLPVEPAAVDLGEVCGGVVEEHSAAHPQRQIAMEASGDARGTWDPHRIAQVISNLLGNALTHGSPHSPVRVLIEGGTDNVTLKVHNHGETIDSEQIPLLFEPFRRAAGTPTASRAGLGLGLHIVKLIVAAHKGSISVRSSEAEGTTFAVVLPRVHSPPAKSG